MPPISNFEIDPPASGIERYRESRPKKQPFSNKDKEEEFCPLQIVCLIHGQEIREKAYPFNSHCLASFLVS